MEEAEHTAGIKDWIPLISSLVVIILFIIDRLINHRFRNSEVERTWYYKVLLEPNLKIINSFFDALEERFNDAAQKIISSINVDHSEYSRCQLEAFEEFKMLKRKLELQVILPIISTHPITGQILTDKLLEIEHVYTSALDNLELTQLQILDVSENLYVLRAEWLKSMYTPVHKKDNLKRGWYKINWML